MKNFILILIASVVCASCYGTYEVSVAEPVRYYGSYYTPRPVIVRPAPVIVHRHYPEVRPHYSPKPQHNPVRSGRNHRR